MNHLQHLAIIMDGNGRWAEAHHKKRSTGHEKGAKVAREITEFASKSNIEYLTLYAFSTENWKRPKSEVEFLMALLTKFLKKEQKVLLENNIRFMTIGDLSSFSKSLQQQIKTTKEATASCTGMTQVLALNYGGKDEIVRAANALIQKEEIISIASLEKALDTKEMPPVDLLIRTGGEMRLSNFLLWQAAYAELHFTKTLWPEFTCKELEAIIASYMSVHRRFGGL